MIGTRRLALAALLLLAPVRVTAAGDLPINGITIGMPVRTLAQTLGLPAAVTSDDSGHRFVFSGGTTAYTDDDGVVLAVDTRIGSPTVEIDGAVRVFPLGSYSTERADAELAGVAEFATSTSRSYRLAPRRDLVLGFGESSGRLERVTYGEPGQLARLGLLPGDLAAKAVAYRAPRPKHAPDAALASGSAVTIFRLSIDRSGAVNDVDIALSSPARADDEELARRLRSDRYVPATLDGRPIAATVFVALSH